LSIGIITSIKYLNSYVSNGQQDFIAMLQA
jgi:hypothetical protein